MPATEPLPATSDPRALALVGLGLAALAVGFVVHRMWLQLPAARFGESIALAGLAAVAAWPLVRWNAWRFASALVLVWTLALILLTGIAPFLAMVLLVAGAAALGSLFTGSDRPLTASVAGAALLAGAVGWLLPLRVHQPFVHGAVLLAILLVRRHAVRAMAGATLAGWRDAVDAAPVAARWSLLLLGLASAAAWLPTLQYDDLAYHLGLPSQLMRHGRYALDPTHQVWALFPWASDVLHGIVQTIARAEARSALNFAWLVAGAAGSWQLAARLGGGARARWSSVAMFASLPTLAMLMGGMQTELPSATVALVLAAAALGSSADARRVHVVALLAGLLIALKPTNGFVALGLVGLALVHCETPRPAVRHVICAVLLACAVAGSSYAYSWAVTGNPVLPLANDIFRSPYFATSAFADARWHAPVDLALPWRLTFATRAYDEGWPGGFGFLLVGFAGAVGIALMQRSTRAIAAVALAAMVAPLLFVPYARYAFPALVLLLPAAVVALHARLVPRHAACVVALLCACNLAFQANSHWILRTAGVKRALSSLGDDAAVMSRYAPARVLNARILAKRPHARVLDLHGATHAELAGAGRTTTWYAPRLHAAGIAADRDSSGARWAALLVREGISDVLLHPAQLTPAQAAGLSRLGADRVLTVDDVEWRAIPSPTVP